MRSRKISAGKLFIKIIFFLVACLFFFVIVRPYIFMLLTSFRSSGEIVQNPGKTIPINRTLSGYEKVMTKSPYFKWFLNSVFVTVTVNEI